MRQGLGVLTLGSEMTIAMTYESISINDCNEFCTPPTTPLLCSGTESCQQEHHLSVFALRRYIFNALTVFQKQRFRSGRIKIQVRNVTSVLPLDNK